MLNRSLRSYSSTEFRASLARNAIEIARQQGRFTIFSLVDALTRLTQKTKFVGDRTEADAKVAALLALAA